MKNGPQLKIMKEIKKTRYELIGPACLICTTYGNFINFQSGLTNADRHALAIFATYTNPEIQIGFIGDHGNFLHNIDTAAN